jgi:hypothetical protein
MVWIAPGFSSFLIGGPSSSVRSGGVISGMGCMIFQPFADRGNWLYPEVWAIIGGPRYPGHLTLTLCF